jgi:hypothetical protein
MCAAAQLRAVSLSLKNRTAAWGSFTLVAMEVRADSSTSRAERPSWARRCGSAQASFSAVARAVCNISLIGSPASAARKHLCTKPFCLASDNVGDSTPVATHQCEFPRAPPLTSGKPALVSPQGAKDTPAFDMREGSDRAEGDEWHPPANPLDPLGLRGLW